MKKIKCSSDNSLLVSPSLKLIAAAAISCAALGASADTYYWKPGTTQGQWTTIENWSTESATGAVAAELPGSDDSLAGVGDYNFDLNGGSYTLSAWIIPSDWNNHNLTVTNGTLTFNGEVSTHSGKINVDAKGKLNLNGPFNPGLYSSAGLMVNANTGGVVSVSGSVRLYNGSFAVNDGGSMTFAPSYLRFGAESHDYALTFSNAGTLTLPNGFKFDRWDIATVETGASYTLTQSGGTLNLGGPIANAPSSSASKPGPFTVVFSGGTVNVTGDVTFNVTSATIDGTVIFNFDSVHTVDFTGVTFAQNAAIVKTGVAFVSLPVGDVPITVSEGGLVLGSGTYDLSDVTFEEGTVINLAYLGGRVDNAPSTLANATFMADFTGVSVGTVVFNSSDATLLAKVKDDLEGLAEFPSDKQLTISGAALRIENKASGYAFSSNGEADILGAAGWGGNIPDAGESVLITGATTVATFSSGTFPQWSSIEVKDSATLRISNDAVLPQITLYPEAKLEIISGTTSLENGIVGSFELVNETVHLPILALATNATLMVASDMKFKNVDMRLCGTVTKPSFNDVGPTFGYADNGEVSYFAMTADGAKFEIHSAEGDNGGNRENGRICFFSPASGGTVLAVGDVLLKNCTRPVNSWGDYGNTIFGQNNPVAAPYNVILDGTSIEASAFVYIAGATRLSLINNSHISRHSSCLGHYFSQAIQDAATVDIGEGCYLDFTTGDGLFGIDSQSAVDAVTVRNGGAYTVSYNSSGWVNGVFVSDGGVLGVSKLYKSSSGDPRERPQDLLAGFGSARLDGDLLISSVNMGTGNYDWDRHTKMANIPFSGTGDVTITNGVPAYPFTVTMQNAANTATGTIKVAKVDGDAETKLYFADGANWAGTVVSGNVALTNLVDSAAACTNTFGTLYLAAGTELKIRIWKTGGVIVAHDGLNVGRYVNNGGKIVLVEMDEELKPGDSFILGTIGDDSSPAFAGRWEGRKVDGCLKVKYSSGLTVIMR